MKPERPSIPRVNYLNNRVFLLRNYRLIVAARKFDVLKTNIVREAKQSKIGDVL